VDSSMAKSACTASANCWDGTVRSCSGDNTCVAQDSNCPLADGYVSCDGVAKPCSPCPDIPCPRENRLCSDDWDCNSYPGCEGCFCSELEGGLKICECPR
jgi:hypothetical protein